MDEREKRYLWLSAKQRLPRQPLFPNERGRKRSEDCMVLIGIIYVNHYRLRWQDAPSGYGLFNTLCNRFARCSRIGIFARIFLKPAQPWQPWRHINDRQQFLMAHRTAASLQKGAIGWAKMT